MAKAENKTKATEASVSDFINAQEGNRVKECKQIVSWMEEITGHKPKMWGPSIVGFDLYHYKYESGREGDIPKTGFSPRKSALTFYIMPGFERNEEIMGKLGKYKTGKSCLYVKKLEDINEEALKELIKEGYDYMSNKYG